MKLGTVLRKYREREGLTLRGLAKEIGIGFAILAQIERGRGCNARTLMRILVWLGSKHTEGKKAA